MLFHVCTAADSDQVSFERIQHPMDNVPYTVLLIYIYCMSVLGLSSKCLTVVCLLFESAISSASLWLCTKLCCFLNQALCANMKYILEQCCSQILKKDILNPCVSGDLFSKYDWNKMTCSKCSYWLYVDGYLFFTANKPVQGHNQISECVYYTAVTIWDTAL